MMGRRPSSVLAALQLRRHTVSAEFAKTHALAQLPLRLHWGWSAGGAVVGALLGLIVFAPARWVGVAVEALSDGRFVLSDANGSVWAGNAIAQLTGGPGSKDGPARSPAVDAWAEQWRARATLTPNMLHQWRGDPSVAAWLGPLDDQTFAVSCRGQRAVARSLARRSWSAVEHVDAQWDRAVEHFWTQPRISARAMAVCGQCRAGLAIDVFAPEYPQ